MAAWSPPNIKDAGTPNRIVPGTNERMRQLVMTNRRILFDHGGRRAGLESVGARPYRSDLNPVAVFATFVVGR
jgi:transposase